MAWILDLSSAQKFSILWNIFDITTDALFINSIRDKHLELSYIASISLMFSIGSFFTMLFLDASFFAASSGNTQESENKTIRRILKMRWGILVFVPLEGDWIISELLKQINCDYFHNWKVVQNLNLRFYVPYHGEEYRWYSNLQSTLENCVSNYIHSTFAWIWQGKYEK